jgi:hypothetical protein
VPHSIIHKLNALCALDFPSRLDTPQPRLDKDSSSLPEHALDLIDGVLDDASRILGAGQRPSAQQIRVFADHGYQLTSDAAGPGNAWRNATIRTPKGDIRYW